jgi:hypothetical protein
MQRVAAETACTGLMAVLLAVFRLTSLQISMNWAKGRHGKHTGNIGKPCQTNKKLCLKVLSIVVIPFNCSFVVIPATMANG